MNHSASTHRLLALGFRGGEGVGWLGKVFAEVATSNQYNRRWTNGVLLGKRPWAQWIPWSGLFVKLRYLCSSKYLFCFGSPGDIGINLKEKVIVKQRVEYIARITCEYKLRFPREIILPRNSM